MTESITIKYKPIIGLDIDNVKVLDVTMEKLLGMICLSSVLAKHRDDIYLYVSDGNIIDIAAAVKLPYFNFVYPYKCKLCYDPIWCETYSFMTHEFIQGANDLCILLGMDPSSHIMDIVNEKGEQIPLSRYINRYYGKLEIPNDTDEKDGEVVHITYLKPRIDKKLYGTLVYTLTECFPGTKIAITLPNTTYFISENKSRNDVIAALMASPNVPDNLAEYSDTYYITSVCTQSDYRREGLAKSLMITMINDLISQGVKRILLEVVSDNSTAYNLYTSLGFIKVKTHLVNDEKRDVLLLSIKK